MENRCIHFNKTNPWERECLLCVLGLQGFDPFPPDVYVADYEVRAFEEVV